MSVWDKIIGLGRGGWGDFFCQAAIIGIFSLKFWPNRLSACQGDG
jgi:hypothetical protein